MQSIERVRGGIVLAHALKLKGIPVVFTLSGGFLNPVLEGLMKYEIPTYNTPHEQVAGHMADGWTRLTRDLVVCLVGPEGFANAVPAMTEAFMAKTPVLFISCSATIKRRGQGGFKEIEDYRIAERITNYSALVPSGERIYEFVDKAIDAAISGQTGPVHLSIPVDILYSSFELQKKFLERPFRIGKSKRPSIWPAPETLNQLAASLGKAKRPVIIGGNGVWWSHAEEWLREFAEKHSIPFYNMPYHQKLMGAGPAYLGLADIHLNPPFEETMQQADLAMVVGCRLDNMLSFGNPPFFPEDLQLITINGSHQEYIENHAADQRVVGDPGAVFVELGKVLDSATSENPDWKPWLNDARSFSDRWVIETEIMLSKENTEGGAHPLRLILDVIDEVGDDDILSFDGGDTHFWSEIGLQLRTLQGRNIQKTLFPGPYSLLGVGVSFATVAGLIFSENHSVLISGDGAFLSGGLSIDVAFDAMVPLTVVVDNNRSFGSIKQQQKILFDNNKTFKTNFRFIQFHDLVKSLGGYGVHVTDQDSIKGYLRKALQSNTIACLNVDTRSVISPLIEGLADRRARSSIE